MDMKSDSSTPSLVLGAHGRRVRRAARLCAAKIFHVEVDPKQEEVRACLAGANCGGCGYPGCDGYAAAVASRRGTYQLSCVAGGAEPLRQQIAEIMGVSGADVEKMVAFVPCSGTDRVTREMRFNYSGPVRIASAAMLFGGKSNKDLHASPASASATAPAPASSTRCTSSTASPRSTATSCVGCMAHAPTPAPRSIIERVPVRARRPCSLPAATMTRAHRSRARCATVGCIGCMKCQRECPADAIKVVDNLAVQDRCYDKCVRLRPLRRYLPASHHQLLR